MRRETPPLFSIARAGGVVACAAALALGGCKKTGAAASEVAQAPSLEDATGQSKCGVKKSSDKPLVIEWPAAERAALEARATKGLVAVRYSGCEMEVLTTCSAAGAYEYVGLTQKTEGVRITNTDQLYAKLPIGAVGLEGKLERAGQLNVDMTIVGRREANDSRFNERDLDGRCDEATHVITGLTVGSFSFYTGKSAEIGAGATVGNVGAGAGSSTDQQVLKTDGDVTACATAGTTDEAPPEGCGALLRVEVVPIDRVFVNPSAPGTTTTAAGAPADDTPPADVDELQRKLAVARGVTFAGYGGAALGLGVTVGGYVLYSRARTSLEAEASASEISSERGDLNSRAKLGAGLMWGGLGFAVLAGTVGILANTRYTALQRQLRLSAAPALGPDGGGLVLRGRF